MDSYFLPTGGGDIFNLAGLRPAWHQWQRAVRSRARKRCKAGKRRSSDIVLLFRHHGSMPPTKDKAPKAAGKGKVEDKVPTTKLEFGYPPDLTNALRAISDRATQDLWHNPSGVGGGEPTAEQLAQKHANMIHKLSKRIAGDVRAKEALKTSLSQWTSALGHHLAALVPRIQAISHKLDDDLNEACQEMQAAAVESATSQEKILQAQAAQLGPAWSTIQEQEIYKIAGALRAFGAVQPANSLPSTSPAKAGGSVPVVLPSRTLNDQDVHRAPVGAPASPVSSTSTMTLGGAGTANTVVLPPESEVATEPR